MPSQAWKAVDFVGLTPAIDPRRSDKFFALGGRNFFFDALGPKSGFGSRLVTPFPLGIPDHAEGFRVGLPDKDRSFLMTSEGIFEWSEIEGNWIAMYVIPSTEAQPYRWTHGYLNGYIFFAHPRTGILVLDITTNLIQPLDVPGAPSDVVSICINNARVVAITVSYFYFSAPSDGLNWTPSLGGAGSQKISNHVSGDPIAVSSYDAGVLTWTTGGVMKAEFTSDQSVYRLSALNTEYRPINSFCIKQLDDTTVVILDRRGLFQTAGLTPKAFAPLFNEFLIEFIRIYKLQDGLNLRLEWDDQRRLMYISYSFSETNPIYESAFVYYQPLDRWGQFNEAHYGILPIHIDSSDRAGDYFGYVSSAGLVSYWTDAGNRESSSASVDTDGLFPLTQVPLHEDPEGSGVFIGSSSVSISPVQDFNLAGRAGYYLSGSLSPMIGVLGGLDAQIRLGLLRFDQVQAADMMTEVNQLIIGSAGSGADAVMITDWNIRPAGSSDEDWNLVSGAQDLGLSPQNQINCDLRIVSTIDGKTEFMSAVPQLERFEKGARYYSLTSQGLWHTLEMTATTSGDAFHLQMFELTATQAGRFS